MKAPWLLIAPCLGILSFAGVAASGATAPPSSPEEMAAAVRSLVASGAGALMPDLDEAYIEDGGLVPLGEGAFPAMFLHGLVAEWRNGAAVFPVEVRLDDDTGDAYFLDALGEPFWYIPSNVPERYRPWLVANPWFAPSRAGIRWTFVHDADAALLRAASVPAVRRPVPLRETFWEEALGPKAALLDWTKGMPHKDDMIELGFPNVPRSVFQSLIFCKEFQRLERIVPETLMP